MSLISKPVVTRWRREHELSVLRYRGHDLTKKVDVQDTVLPKDHVERC